MTVRKALKEGFTLARRAKPVVWILFLTNLGLAALAAIPIYRGILRSTGYSLVAGRLASAFQVDWLVDFQFESVGSLDRYASAIAAVGLLSIPINTILAGGALSFFRIGAEPFSLGGFFRSAARYAWRLIRLMILGLICYWILFRILNQWLNGVITERTGDWQSDRWVFALHAAVWIVLLLGLAFVNMVMDYARTRLVVQDATSAAESFLHALGFALSRFRCAATVYAIPSLGGVALLGIYWLIVPWSTINAATSGSWAQYREPITLALLFLGQQVVMFGRYWFRLATWASEWSYYSSAH